MPQVVDVASGYKCIDSIFQCQSVSEIKATATGLIAAIENVSNCENGMYAYMICGQLRERFAEWAKPYSLLAKSAAWNAIIVPPEDASIMILPTSVPLGGRPVDVVSGLKQFVMRCDEIVMPDCDAITAPEMKRVLSIAQKTYRLLDIIAPTEPLLILRFDNSHTVYNSQCAVPSNNNQAVIFSFHPNDVSVHDRVFIFSHELGHALHLALTHDITVLPDGFEVFNQSLGVNLETLKEKQEAFADSVALSILNAKGLRTHFPTQWSQAMSYSHAKYLRGLCTCKLQESGLLSESLPQPYSPVEKALRKIAAHSGNAIAAKPNV